MKVRGNVVVLCHEGSRLSAVWGVVQKDRVRVAGWHIASQPSELDASDAQQVGAWVAGQLKQAGCRAKTCVIAVPRANVVLKRVSLPVSSDVREGELAGMVRLQMARQLTMPLAGAAIDYVRLGADTEGEPSNHSEVLAAALPGAYVENAQGLAKHAKKRLAAVALRGEGSATLFSELSYTQDGPVLGVSVSPHGVELGVVSEGRAVFSRAVEIATPTDVEGWGAFAQRVAIEAKRTRVSYRGTGETGDLTCIGVLGDDALTDAVGQALGDDLGLPWHRMRFPNTVDTPSEMDSSTRAALAPLIGLMVGAAMHRPTYDFSNPRKAPDPSAAIRQVALAGAFGLIVCVGGAWVVADQQRRSLQNEVEDAEKEAQALVLQYVGQLRAEARVNHLSSLQEESTDWLGHFHYLTDTLPPAEQMRLESITGAGESSVRFAGPDGEDVDTLEKGRWQGTRRVSFLVAGSASREIADKIRADLVADNVYELSTRGADMEGKFEYALESGATSPWGLADETDAEAGGESGQEVGQEVRQEPDAQGGES